MADNRSGQQLGNYRLTRLLGQGGFADVYLGEHIYLKTQAAIKILQIRLAGDDMESFLNEARTIASLKHPHIVRVLDFGVEGATPFLVMDYAPLGTLRQRYPKGTRLPLATIVSYVKQVASALQYAHERKLIHRDIKPENMLLESVNEILLSDFGIALFVQSSDYQTTQETAGTVAYMAPEQLQGKPRPASDQYALGIVVYEWLSGDRPFHGSFTEMYSQHLLVPPPPLSEKIPAISRDIETVVQKALAKDPQQRFKTVQNFAKALEEAYQGKLPTLVTSPRNQPSQPHMILGLPGQSSEPTVEATTPGHSARSTFDAIPPRQIARQWPPLGPSEAPQMHRRGISRRTVLLGLAGLVAVSGGITWLALSQNHTPPGGPSTSSPPTGALLFTYHGHTDSVGSVTWSPGGQRLASASGDHTVQVWDASTGGYVFTYRGHSDQVQSVAWSPKGKYIASASNDRTVQVWDATSGSTIATYRHHSDIVWAVVWSSDEQRIASASSDRTVQVWEATTGNTIYTYSGHTDTVYAVSWSFDGLRIASGSFDGTVQVWDAPIGNKAFTYHGHSDQVTAVAWSPDNTHIASGSKDKTAQIWNAATGSTTTTYHGHADTVEAVAWAPNGRHIASASTDHTVQIWNNSSGSATYTYYGHAGPIWSVAWSPDSRYIASASKDKTVQVWQAS
ncbi:MAG: WD40 repeat domain-containing serine/threonine protein kinase [Ktedonobacteraceae bacterium]